MKTTDLFAQPAKELTPGIRTQGFTGDKLMVTHLIFEAGAVGAPHSHPHEQLAVVLRGEIEFTVGSERRVLKAGEAISLPGNVEHGAVALTETELIEMFTPIRTDLAAKLGLEF